MARVQFIGPGPVTVPELGGRLVNPEDIVEVPDDRYVGYIPAPEHRSADHPWTSIEEPGAKPVKSAAKVKDN